jgi:hypothetical protein
MRLPIPPLQQTSKWGLAMARTRETASFRSLAAGTHFEKVPDDTDAPGTQRHDPDGIRTRVAALKGPCPRPLDDGASALVSLALGHLRRHLRRRQVRRIRPGVHESRLCPKKKCLELSGAQGPASVEAREFQTPFFGQSRESRSRCPKRKRSPIISSHLSSASRAQGMESQKKGSQANG